jgi:hypothetical protein
MPEPTNPTAPAGTTAPSVVLPDHAKVVERISDLTARIGELRRHL